MMTEVSKATRIWNGFWHPSLAAAAKERHFKPETVQLAKRLKLTGRYDLSFYERSAVRIELADYLLQLRNVDLPERGRLRLEPFGPVFQDHNVEQQLVWDGAYQACVNGFKLGETKYDFESASLIVRHRDFHGLAYSKRHEVSVRWGQRVESAQ